MKKLFREICDGILMLTFCLPSFFISGTKENPQSVQRLIDWNADVLVKLLKQVIGKREVKGKGGWDDDPEIPLKANIVDEVSEVIELPEFSAQAANAKPIDVPDMVKQQLKEYVTAIASAYRANPYHSLQHASHVAMAVSNLYIILLHFSVVLV